MAEAIAQFERSAGASDDVAIAAGVDDPPGQDGWRPPLFATMAPITLLPSTIGSAN